MPTFYGPPSDGSIIPQDLGDAIALDLADPMSTLGSSLTEALAALGIRRAPVNAWVHWGDSMTSGAGWVAKFAADLGHDAYNGGVGGETAQQIHDRMVAPEADQYRNRKFTISAGRNGFKTESPESIATTIRKMLNHITSQHQGFVLDVAPWAEETLPAAVGSNRERLDKLNALLKEWFPGYYFPVFSLLRQDEAAIVAGIAFTDQDRTDIANGVTPVSFRADGGHLNTAGGKAVAYYLHREAYRRGYVATHPVVPVSNLLTNYVVVPDPSVQLGWTGSGNGTIPYTNAQGAHTYKTVTGMDLPTAARFVGAAGMTGYPEITIGNSAVTRAPIPAEGGQFTASLQVRASKDIADFQLRVTPFGAETGGKWGPKVALQAGVAQRVSFTVDLAPGVTHASIAAIAPAGSMSDGSSMDVTAVMLTKGATVYPYRDGSSTGWAWAGTAKQSTSTGPVPA